MLRNFIIIWYILAKLQAIRYHSSPIETSQGTEPTFAEDKAYCLDLAGSNTSVATKVGQNEQVHAPWRTISTATSQWVSPAWITELSRSKGAEDCNLVRHGFLLPSQLAKEVPFQLESANLSCPKSVFEEPSDELPPTQPLPSQPTDQRHSMSTCTSPPATSCRQLSPFTDERADLEGKEAEFQYQDLPKQVKSDKTSCSRYSPTNFNEDLCASPFIPPSSDVAVFESTPLSSEPLP